MRISQLEGRRVALWGWGREGRAAYRAVRDRCPDLPLVLLCSDDEATQAAALADPLLTVETDASGERLSAFDIVIKSPGISPRCEPVTTATQHGTRFIGGTALWFAEQAAAGDVAGRTVCVTGTKGKSTTTALLAHLLRAAGERTALAGNIGLPLLELIDGKADAWAIELSSYQTGDVADSGVRPDIAVALNLFPEHLDWHGSEARYVEDKLRLLTDARPRIAILNAADPRLAVLELPGSEVRWFGNPEGWHLREDLLFRGDQKILDTTALPLPGRHNRGNLCAVLTVLEALGLDAVALASHAVDFQPLPHRLQTLGTRDGIRYVNDSISTTPHASLAALSCFPGQPVAILVGGHDRGLDWSVFAEQVPSLGPKAVITMGANGPRIHEQLASVATDAGFGLAAADDMADALAKARTLLSGEGIILLSPGAPSFGVYTDYVARGRDFAALAGFDPAAISTIQGLGIA